jgi:hypothetical protein
MTVVGTDSSLLADVTAHTAGSLPSLGTVRRLDIQHQPPERGAVQRAAGVIQEQVGSALSVARRLVAHRSPLILDAVTARYAQRGRQDRRARIVHEDLDGLLELV